MLRKEIKGEDEQLRKINQRCNKISDAHMREEEIKRKSKKDANRIWRRVNKLLSKMTFYEKRDLFVGYDIERHEVYYAKGFLDPSHKMFLFNPSLKHPVETMQALKKLAEKNNVRCLEELIDYEIDFLTTITVSGIFLYF